MLLLVAKALEWIIDESAAPMVRMLAIANPIKRARALLLARPMFNCLHVVLASVIQRIVATTGRFVRAATGKSFLSTRGGGLGGYFHVSFVNCHEDPALGLAQHTQSTCWCAAFLYSLGSGVRQSLSAHQ